MLEVVDPETIGDFYFYLYMLLLLINLLFTGYPTLSFVIYNIIYLYSSMNYDLLISSEAPVTIFRDWIVGLLVCVGFL